MELSELKVGDLVAISSRYGDLTGPHKITRETKCYFIIAVKNASVDGYYERQFAKKGGREKGADGCCSAHMVPITEDIAMQLRRNRLKWRFAKLKDSLTAPKDDAQLEFVVGVLEALVEQVLP